MDNLKKIRKSKGLSQKDLAEKTGLTIRIISYYENEATSPPIDKIQIIAEQLGVTISDLLSDKISKSIKTQYDNLNSKLLKKINDINSLPTKEQNKIMDYIETIIKGYEYEKKNMKEVK